MTKGNRVRKEQVDFGLRIRWQGEDHEHDELLGVRWREGDEIAVGVWGCPEDQVNRESLLRGAGEQLWERRRWLENAEERLRKVKEREENIKKVQEELTGGYVEAAGACLYLRSEEKDPVYAMICPKGGVVVGVEEGAVPEAGELKGIVAGVAEEIRDEMEEWTEDIENCKESMSQMWELIRRLEGSEEEAVCLWESWQDRREGDEEDDEGE